jgi:putative ABC transport system permease protein
MNVRDQARELALLRALGLGTREVRRLVLLQAFFLCLFGALPGAPLGLVLAYLAGQGRPDLLVVGGCCGLALAVAALAAVFPAYFATRASVKGQLGP